MTERISRLLGGDPWRIGHVDAFYNPRGVEVPIMAAVLAARDTAIAFGQDNVLREGVAEIINGALVLLNADLGRLDGGTLWGFLNEIAQSIGYDLDVQRFTDGAGE